MIKIRKGRKGLTVLSTLVSVMLFVTVLPSCSLTRQGGNTRAVETGDHRISIYPKDQGLYDACSPSNTSYCYNRLKQMARAGFTLVVNYDQFNGTAQQQLAYAHQAYVLGMKIIWNMSDPAFWNGTDLLSYYADLAASCTCFDNNGFIRYVVGLVKNLPATWGYYVGDEVKQQDHAKMKAIADLVQQLDPSHPRLFVSSEDASTMGSNLKPFVDTAEIVGGDIYPVGTTDPITTVGEISRAIQFIADLNNKQSMVVLQAFSWSQYPNELWRCSPFPDCASFPTKDEMHQMLDLVLKNSHPQFIFWYSYFDILKSDHAADHWRDLMEAITPPQTSATHP